MIYIRSSRNNWLNIHRTNNCTIFDILMVRNINKLQMIKISTLFTHSKKMRRSCKWPSSTVRKVQLPRIQRVQMKRQMSWWKCCMLTECIQQLILIHLMPNQKILLSQFNIFWPTKKCFKSVFPKLNTRNKEFLNKLSPT